jgi:hypothetical protein
MPSEGPAEASFSHFATAKYLLPLFRALPKRRPAGTQNCHQHHARN